MVAVCPGLVASVADVAFALIAPGKTGSAGGLAGGVAANGATPMLCTIVWSSLRKLMVTAALVGTVIVIAPFRAPLKPQVPAAPVAAMSIEIWLPFTCIQLGAAPAAGGGGVGVVGAAGAA